MSVEQKKETQTRPAPKPQELYRHFKGNLYQVLTLARHSESGETLVVYQALYGTYGVWARPLSLFLSEVDREKYPETAQRYRFEKVKREKLSGGNAGERGAEPGALNPQTEVSQNADFKPEESLSAGIGQEDFLDLQTGVIQETVSKPEESLSLGVGQEASRNMETEVFSGAQREFSDVDGTEENSLDPLVEAFLDADGTREKLRLLEELRPRVTDGMIDTMAMASGVEIEEGDVQERLNDLGDCLRTIERYEQTRERFR
ncbi:MAG: DUF1653 domain-containing protein [Eubacteriales bacterium]|nr:DUF1653 domain-containing protein [Eubacteriales bacterium]